MRFLLALLGTNLKAVLALRTTFVLQAGFMVLNNLLFFVFWWVMFERFDQIRGWRIEDVAVLFGVAAGGYGLAEILAGGVSTLARRIEEGGLDPMLTLPRSVLVQAAAAKTSPAGWGDVVSGLVLIGLSGHLTPSNLPVVLGAMLVSGFMFAASGIVVHCVAFWLGRVEALARQAAELVITFSVYPPTLFGPALKVVLFTVVPAGLVSYVPASLVREFDVGVLALAIVGSAIYGGLAWWVFRRGLRRYASGSRFGVRC